MYQLTLPVLGSRLSEAFFRYFGGDISILCFHRVVEDSKIDSSDPNSTYMVSKSYFFELISFLSSRVDFISMDALLQTKTMSRGRLKCVVTFDDGYKDNLTIAAPILRQFKVPATFYVSNRFLNGDLFTWWDTLGAIVSNENRLFCEFRGKKLEFVNDTHRLKWINFHHLGRKLMTFKLEEQREFIRSVKLSRPIACKEDQLLSWNDLRILSLIPNFQIGSHSYSHSVLETLNDVECELELRNSKLELEGFLNKQIKHFAFPYGHPNSYSDRHLKILTVLGFESAVTGSIGKIDKNRPLELPRYVVENGRNKSLVLAEISGLVAVLGRKVPASLSHKL
jgi:peptidoglycan/xylan/chitin deacetylase (PgdA/CDA1 family)